MKRILLLTTGGTIASRRGRGGLAPSLGAESLLGVLGVCRPDVTLVGESVMNLDSSNIQPEHWQLLARRIYSALDSCDGIIITHGTDTMAYTASALAFMLRNLGQSVVLTGSQLPSEAPGSDAARNMHIALEAVLGGITGVTVAFGSRVINGTRAVKTSTANFDAFESINARPMAVLNSDGLSIFEHAVSNRGNAASITLEDGICGDVFLLKIVPGTRPEIFRALMDMGYRGVVVEAFGSGCVHYEGRDLAAGVRSLSEAGIPVVVVSQCLRGRVNLSAYETGIRLLDAGAIGGNGMTTESAVVKLMWALGKTRDRAEVSEIFSTDYAGEAGFVNTDSI
ncbi:MAG: asparaginase [Synergistaceae bacterium]|jgi:L-asparaginase|nr:asparaginase [Synergistaceae bacterium]